MPVSIYDTAVSVQLFDKQLPKADFLAKLFPTTSIDLLASENAVVPYKDGLNKTAPFVVSQSTGIAVERAGVQSDVIPIPQIVVKRPLTYDNITHTIPGEQAFGSVSPEEREMYYLKTDSEELSRFISLSEEVMRASLLINSGYTLREYTEDNYGTDRYISRKIYFYDDNGVGNNPNLYEPTASWKTPTADIIGDLFNMSAALRRSRNPANVLILTSDVLALLYKNTAVRELLAIGANMNFAAINPQDLGNGASFVGNLNAMGANLSVYSYDLNYTDNSGNNVPILPAGTVILTSTSAGKTLYGPVKFMDDEKRMQYYRASRASQLISDQNSNSRTLKLGSRPLVVPNSKSGWICANVTDD
jgi:hypothetical protein